jgi:S-DNA-T family DNA segregation ATPase FtsK/SpoIIIE
MTTNQFPYANSIDGEVVEESTAQELAVPTQRGANRQPAPPMGGQQQPILAPWMKDRAEFVYKMRDVGKRAAYILGWHLLHAPANALRVLWFAACGLFYIVGNVWVWTFDLHSPKQEFTNEEYVKLNQNRERRLSQRGQVVGYGAGAIGLVGLIVWWAAPPWVSWGLLVAVVIVLALVGRPRDKPFIMPATIAPGEDVPLTADVVFEALCSLGIPKMTKPQDLQLLYAVKPSRAGYIIDITLPRGVTATEVMAKREKLSSGLQRGIGTVWPSVGERHEGHLVLFISHQDMSRAKQKTWPLLRQGSVDVFNPVPMFTDQRGDWVDLRIATTSGVVGAIPRMGKTYFLRELALVAALDVRTEEYIFELKGTGDLSSTKLFAHFYSDSDEEEDIAQHLVVMRKLFNERRRRAKVIRSLSNEECPRSEVTTELASRRALGLHPILVEVDECQVWFEHPVKEIRDEFIRIVEDLVRRGPAVGIMVYLATQKVDVKSIPSGISANASVRVCFKVNDATSNNQILGPGSYANGLQATMFDFVKDKGIAYLKADGPGQIVRTVFALDKVESDKVAARARWARKRADRLTGYAAGEDMAVEEEEIILVDEILSALLHCA